MLPLLLAILLMHPDGKQSDVVLTDGKTAQVLATLSHRTDGIANARFLPGTRTVMIIADTGAVDREGRFGASLFRAEPGRPVVEICSHVRRITSPLVTTSGRLFVVRGREGNKRNEEVPDPITIEEVKGKSLRVVARMNAWELWPLGEANGELVLHRAAPDGVSLIAVAMSTGAVRTIARDLEPGPRVNGSAFLDGEHVIAEHGRPVRIERVHVKSGAIEHLATTTTTSPTTPVAFRGDVLYSSGGLRLAKGGAIEHAGEEHLIDVVDGDRAILRHVVERNGETRFDIELLTNDGIVPVPLPPHRAARAFGFVDEATEQGRAGSLRRAP